MTVRSAFVLVAAILAGLVFRVHFFTGLIASDDLTYGTAAYYMFSSEQERPFEDATAGGVAVRRIGLNLPIFICMQLFGIHEWSMALGPLVLSLAGIPLMYGLLRIIAGEREGLLAAWLWACLPVDVYTATLWLPDNIFATFTAAFLFFIYAAEHAKRYRWLLAFAAGLSLGYVEYVKEVAYFFMFPLFLWWGYTWWRSRKFEWNAVGLLAGFLVMQGLASVYFWSQGGHPLVFWRLAYLRYTDVMAHFDYRNPYPENLITTYRYLTEEWAFGYAVAAFPLLMLVGWFSRPLRLKFPILLILLLQAYIVYEGVKLGHWTQRYLLQASPTVLLLLVMGLHELTRRFPGRWYPRLFGVLAVALVVATASSLDHAHQQHGRFRADVLRKAHIYLDSTAGPDDTIYLVSSNVYWDGGAVPFYTQRALMLLNEMKPYKGGFRDFAEAYEAEAGWVVLTHLESKYLNRPGDEKLWGLKPNWLEVFRAVEPENSSYYSRVFKILPTAPSPSIEILDEPLYPEFPPDVAHLDFQRLLLGSPEHHLSSRWQSEPARIDVSRSEGGLRCDVTSAAEALDSAYGGVMFRVPSLAAFRTHLTLENQDQVEALYVYGYGEGAGQVMRWRWRPPTAQRLKGLAGKVVLAANRPSGYFRLEGSAPPESIRELHVFLRTVPGGSASLVVRDPEIAVVAEPVPRPHGLTPIEFVGNPSQYEGRRSRGLLRQSLSCDEDWLVCRLAGQPDGPDRQYGGIGFDVDSLGALELSLAVANDENVRDVWVDGYDAEFNRVARWVWKLSRERPAYDLPRRHCLIVGESSDYFEAVEAGDGADVRRVELFVRIQPGADAAFFLGDVAVGPAPREAATQPTSAPRGVAGDEP